MATKTGSAAGIDPEKMFLLCIITMQPYKSMTNHLFFLIIFSFYHVFSLIRLLLILYNAQLINHLTLNR